MYPVSLSVQQLHQLTAARWDAVPSLEVDILVARLAIAGAVLVHIDHWIFLFALIAFDGEAGRVVFCGNIFTHRYQFLIEAISVHQHTPQPFQHGLLVIGLGREVHRGFT